MCVLEHSLFISLQYDFKYWNCVLYIVELLFAIFTRHCFCYPCDRPVGAMAKDPLAEAGFYFDDLNKLRVLEPNVSQKTSELKEECKDFVDSKYAEFC